MTCPIDMPKELCDFCDYVKEGKCDHPYSIKMKLGEIKDVTKGSKDGTR